VRLRRLLPGGSLVSADDALTGACLERRAPPGGKRPSVLLNMISTADGRATIEGRSGPLGNRADRELFHGLRRSVDAVMAGAGTIRAERYGRIIRDEGSRTWRSEHGLSPEPLAVIVSARLALPTDLPLLACADARVVILTASAATLPDHAASVEYVRTSRGGNLDLAEALELLRERFGVRTLLCEGGPHLNSHLLLAGVVDELFLSLSPKLAGDPPAAPDEPGVPAAPASLAHSGVTQTAASGLGTGAAGGTPAAQPDAAALAARTGTGAALRIVAGAHFPEPLELELCEALESESQLFLRYRLLASASECAGSERSASERASPETIESTSVAS
jgi:riboflavin biosynthesis pyrimidine reductase